jgi:hypothetical protein
MVTCRKGKEKKTKGAMLNGRGNIDVISEVILAIFNSF